MALLLLLQVFFSDARIISEIASKPPEPLKSAYFASPSTVLNLLRYRDVDDLRYTVSKSLASFLDRKKAVALRESADKLSKEDGTEDLSQSKEKKLEKRIRREKRQADELENRQIDLLQKSLEGLERLEHLEDGKLTEKGYWAANLCTSLVLELAEAINDKLLDGIGLVELVGLMASISGTSHKNYMTIAENPVEKFYFNSMKDIVERVSAAYERPPTSTEVEVMPEAAITVLHWMESESWSEFSSILRLSGVAEGDVARLVSQTAEHLNQLSRLQEHFPNLAATAEEGRFRILRPPLTEVLATTSS